MSNGRFRSTPVDHRTLTLEPHRIGSPSTGQRQREGRIQPMYVDRPRSARMLALVLIATIAGYTIAGGTALALAWAS